MTITPAIARAYLGAGLSVVPAVRNGSEKRVALDSWKAFQQRRSTEAECDGWFARPGQSIAIVCGAVSGHCEVIDFDAQGEAWNAWRDHIREEQPDLLDQLVIESTPSGGKHVVYRCEEPVDGHLALASRRITADGPEEIELFGKRLKPRKDADGRWHVTITLIETRGEGNICLCAPSEGYVLEQGALTELPVITADERELLLTAARMLGDLPKTVIDGPPAKKKPSGTASNGDRPGDDFNRRGDVREVLQHHGWERTRTGANEYWRRPGKDFGWSATLKGGVFYVFTTNADPFEEKKAYAPFAVFTLLEHNGDFKAAAKALAAQGYGTTRSRPSVLVNGNGQSALDERASLPSDIGNAARLGKRYGGRIRYCHPTRTWYIWDGRRWREDDRGQIMKLCKKTALGILNEVKHAPEHLQTELIKWCRRSQQKERLVAMALLAQPDVAVTPDELDTDIWLLNCANGTIDLRTGELHPHRQSDMITKLVDIDFDPNAACPRFEQFLTEICDRDLELVAFLQRLFGHALTGDVSEQFLFIFHGEGQNGKSVLLDTISAVLGPYAIESPPNLLKLRGYDEHPTEIAALCGARFVVASETEEGMKLRLQLLKQLTGNARLTARYMRQDYFQFDRTHKLILVTNNIPQVEESTQAVWRRLVLVPFYVTIPPAQQDKGLPQKLLQERVGILAWMVRGCEAWRAHGLAFPRAVLRSTSALRYRANSLIEFIESECEVAQGNFVTSKDLNSVYAAWCRENDRPPIATTALGATMRSFGCRYDKSAGKRGWFGVALRGGDEVRRGRSGPSGHVSGVQPHCHSPKALNPKPVSTPATPSTNGDFGTENNDSGRSEWSL